MIALNQNSESFENTSGLELKDALNCIRTAYTKYPTCTPELNSFSMDSNQVIQMSNLDVGHEPKVNIRCQSNREMIIVETDQLVSPQNTSIDVNFTYLSKADYLQSAGGNRGTVVTSNEVVVLCYYT